MYNIIVPGVLLLLFGVAAMFSTSTMDSFQLTLKLVNKGLLNDTSNLFYFYEHIIKLVVGVVLGAIIYTINRSRIKQYKRRVIGSTCILTILVLTPLGIEFNGSKARLSIPGGTIQPGEFWKLGMILFLSDWLSRKQYDNSREFFIRYGLILGLCVIVFMFMPDFGSVLVFGLVGVILYYYATGNAKHILILGGIGIILGSIAITQFDYINRRFMLFVDPLSDTSGRGIGRQTKQALYAIGGGGIVGKGYSKGLQKFGYIPEAQSDFIFAAFSEEIGFLGNTFLLGLYLWLGRYCIYSLNTIISKEDRFIVTGIISMILVQTFINIGVNINIVPLTGLTLPFVSHGGSALIVNIIQLTLLIKIIHNPEGTLTQTKKKSRLL